MNENAITAGTLVAVKNALNDPWKVAVYIQPTINSSHWVRTSSDTGELIAQSFNYVKVHNGNEMDWKSLYAGKILRAEVMKAIANEHWQIVRKNMKGIPLIAKYVVLQNYLHRDPNNRTMKVRVTNYVTALSRGGLIKPEEYREV